jgi:hypothetical protein
LRAEGGGSVLATCVLSSAASSPRCRLRGHTGARLDAAAPLLSLASCRAIAAFPPAQASPWRESGQPIALHPRQAAFVRLGARGGRAEGAHAPVLRRAAWPAPLGLSVFAAGGCRVGGSCLVSSACPVGGPWVRFRFRDTLPLPKVAVPSVGVEKRRGAASRRGWRLIVWC